MIRSILEIQEAQSRNGERFHRVVVLLSSHYRIALLILQRDCDNVSRGAITPTELIAAAIVMDRQGNAKTATAEK
jgi:hypothetical protein